MVGLLVDALAVEMVGLMDNETVGQKAAYWVADWVESSGGW